MKHSHLLFSLITAAVLTCVLLSETSALQTPASILLTGLACFGAVTACLWLVFLIFTAVGFLIDLYQFIRAANDEPDESDSEFDDIERALKTRHQEPETRN